MAGHKPNEKKKMGGGMSNKKRMGMAIGGAMEIQKPN